MQLLTLAFGFLMLCIAVVAMHLHERLAKVLKRVEALEKRELLHHAFCEDCGKRIRLSEKGTLYCECEKLNSPYYVGDLPEGWDIRADTVRAVLRDKGF